MDDAKRNLKGSEKRDTFKQMHKALYRGFYALDIDFLLVSKNPLGIVAILDYKDPRDSVTFTEVLAYNVLKWFWPIYIVEGENPETGPFTIRTYLGGNPTPKPPKVELGKPTHIQDWSAFGQWEQRLRSAYTKRKRWEGF